MIAFKTKRADYFKKELISWFSSMVVFGIVSLIFAAFNKWNSEAMLTGFIGVFLVKLVDSLIQLHITEVKVNSNNDKLLFFLDSMLSGDRTRIYELNQLTSILKENNNYTAFTRGPVTLKILLPKKEIFSIDGRYGFSPENLQAIHAIIANAKITDYKSPVDGELKTT